MVCCVLVMWLWSSSLSTTGNSLGRRWLSLPVHFPMNHQHQGWKQKLQRYVRSTHSATTKVPSFRRWNCCCRDKHQPAALQSKCRVRLTWIDHGTLCADPTKTGSAEQSKPIKGIYLPFRAKVAIGQVDPCHL